jgi:uncharacterized protein YdeI (YjbR/CyaY-like superfamily)
MMAFKEHLGVWFHKGALISDPKKLFDKADDKGMRSYKIFEGETLKEAAFLELVKKAVALNEKGVKVTDAKPARKALKVPKDLADVLNKDETARDHWKHFTYSRKKEYVEWITEARQEETRKRRIAESFQMIREGIGKEDKYRGN